MVDIPITNISGNGFSYVIDKPGKYYLTENINNFIIVISSDDVELDGNRYNIEQLDKTIKNIIGIQINPNHKNIHIKNINIKNFSGGGILCNGSTSNIVINNVNINNCGYNGLIALDKNSIPMNSANLFSFGLLFDGGYNKPINNVKIIDCNFVELGILRNIKYGLSTSAIVAYQTNNLLIKGCTIDGCIGYAKSYAITLLSLSDALLDDVFITDIYSSKDAQGIYAIDVDADAKDVPQSGIISNMDPNRYIYCLDNHINIKDNIEDDPNYPIEALHLKKVIPKHVENLDILEKEHKWREFRTMYRLVCHDSDKKSKTSAIYAKWTELFCERVLGVKVKVEAGFANLYLNGDTPLPLHRDQYKKWIFGLSFGETRTIDFIPDAKETKTVSYTMESGDILLFSHDVNNRYQHRMLAEPDKINKRINLTYFIEILPGHDPNKLLIKPTSYENIPSFEEASLFLDSWE